MHKEHDCYVPELVFGHLSLGSDGVENRPVFFPSNSCLLFFSVIWVITWGTGPGQPSKIPTYKIIFVQVLFGLEVTNHLTSYQKRQYLFLSLYIDGVEKHKRLFFFVKSDYTPVI